MIKKMSTLELLIVSVMMTACDSIESMGGSRGDIIVVGNGILNLNESDGVLADLDDPRFSGPISLIVSPVKTESLVRDREKLEDVPTYFNWVTQGEKSDPVLSLEIRDDRKKCRYFEPLQNGDLICRRDLEQYDISASVPPAFTRFSEVFFLDSENRLRRLVGERLDTVADGVESFVIDREANLFVKARLSDQYVLWRSGAFSDLRWSAQLPPFRGEDGAIYYLQLSNPSGLIRWTWDPMADHPHTDLVSAWNPDWNFRSLVTDREGSMQHVQIDDALGKRLHVQLSQKGLEVLEKREADEDMSGMKDLPHSAMQIQRRDHSSLSFNVEWSSGRYCRSGSSPSKPLCLDLRVQESRRPLDALLKTSEDIYVLSASGNDRWIEHWRFNDQAAEINLVQERLIDPRVFRFRLPTEQLEAQKNL
jgi:hypothetical protein